MPYSVSSEELSDLDKISILNERFKVSRVHINIRLIYY